MDSQNTTYRQTAMKKQGLQSYGTIAGVLCLDLLMLLGELPLAMMIPVILISLVIVYRELAIHRKSIDSTGVYRQDKEPDNEDHAGNHGAAIQVEAIQEPQQFSATGSLADIRLLLLSGSNKTRREITNHLKGWGVKYKEVESSARAFARLIESSDAGRPFQAVLVDQSNLDMEESQFAIALRAEASLQSLYLIHYGNNTMPSRIEQLYMAGYSGVLSSPLDKTLLFKALHNACETSSHHHDVVQLLDHYEAEKSQLPLDILVGCHSNNESRKIHRILSNAGHQAFVVDDTTQILDALDNHHFDLAILDAEMSEISGVEAVKLYRFAHLSQPWTPFILLLETPNSETIAACETAEIEHLLAKPIATQRLLETVARATDLTSQGHNNDIFDYPTAFGSTQYHDDSLTLDTHQLNELKRLGKGKEFLLELINQFGKESMDLLHDLQQATTARDVNLIQNCGHKLKDTAGNLGALNLYRMAVRLTRTQKLDSRDELDNLISEIGICRTATVEALHEYISQGDNPAYRKE